MLFNSVFRNVNVTLLCITNAPTMLYAACPEKWSFLSGGWGDCRTWPPLSEFSGFAPGVNNPISYFSHCTVSTRIVKHIRWHMTIFAWFVNLPTVFSLTQAKTKLKTQAQHGQTFKCHWSYHDLLKRWPDEIQTIYFVVCFIIFLLSKNAYDMVYKLDVQDTLCIDHYRFLLIIN